MVSLPKMADFPEKCFSYLSGPQTSNQLSPIWVAHLHLYFPTGTLKIYPCPLIHVATSSNLTSTTIYGYSAH